MRVTKLFCAECGDAKVRHRASNRESARRRRALRRLAQVQELQAQGIPFREIDGKFHRLKYADRFCSYCGSAFHPQEGDQRFCSHGCSNAFLRKRSERICEGCGVTFWRRHVYAGKFCSRECSFANCGTHPKHPGIWFCEVEARQCTECGQWFYSKGGPSKASDKYRWWGRYRIVCSPICAARRENHLEATFNIRQCDWCRRAFFRRVDQGARGQRWCSKECGANARLAIKGTELTYQEVPDRARHIIERYRTLNKAIWRIRRHG